MRLHEHYWVIIDGERHIVHDQVKDSDGSLVVVSQQHAPNGWARAFWQERDDIFISQGVRYKATEVEEDTEIIAYLNRIE